MPRPPLGRDARHDGLAPKCTARRPRPPEQPQHRSLHGRWPVAVPPLLQPLFFLRGSTPSGRHRAAGRMFLAGAQPPLPPSRCIEYKPVLLRCSTLNATPPLLVLDTVQASRQYPVIHQHANAGVPPCTHGPRGTPTSTQQSRRRRGVRGPVRGSSSRGDGAEHPSRQRPNGRLLAQVAHRPLVQHRRHERLG